MTLTIRKKVLAAYVLLAALALAVLMVNLFRFHRIDSRLTVIQEGYLPIAKGVASFANFYHLDDSFDAAKILANRQNRQLLESIAYTSPGLVEDTLRRGLAQAQKVLARTPSAVEYRSLMRISGLIEDLIVQHADYVEMIRSVEKNVRAERGEEALGQNEALIRQKRLVRARLGLLSRRLDDLVARGILLTRAEGRNALYWSAGLALGALLLSLLIGLIPLLSLRPLGRLREVVREIASGALDRRVDIKTGDEVGELAREFNGMAESIQQRDEALRRQQEQIVASERMAVVGRMASRISHEIRNPLNALSLNAEILADEVRAESGRKTLASIAHEIDRLNRVAENYLAISRPVASDAGGVTDLKGALAHVESLLGPESGRRGVKLHFESDDPLPPVRGETGRIEQALINLVRNSVEAASDGGSVTVRARAGRDCVLMEVSDDGCGIAPEDLPHIFDPFFTTKLKGTGLGLAITREILTEHGGGISCHSSPGRGTTFHVTLPLSPHDV